MTETSADRTPPPVTRYRVASSDPDEAVEHMRAAYTSFDMRPVDPAGYEFSLRSVSTGPLALSVVRHAAPMLCRAEPPDPFTALVALGETRLRFGVGEQIAHGPVLLAPPSRYTAETENSAIAVVTLDRGEVTRFAAEISGLDPGDVAFTGMSPRSPALAGYWPRLVDHVRRNLLAHDELLASPLLRAQAVDTLVAGLLAVFPNTTHTIEPGGGRESGEPATVRRAVEFIDAHAHEAITITDIAAESGIGVRGVQNAFARHRDVTPLGYLRRVRMHRAHAELVAADPTRGDTVAAIAARWGFANPGRFAVEYRQVFGRSPGTTLRE